MKKIFAPMLFIAVAACAPPSDGNISNDALISNATTVFEDDVRDADQRADRLDEEGTRLENEGNTIGGTAGGALENHGASDLSQAAAVRASGRGEAIEAEDQMEANAGLLNKQ